MSKGRPAVKPKNVKGQIAARTEFWRGELTKVIKGMFEVTCPLEWDTEYFLNILIKEGVIAITDSVAGTLPFRASLTGVNYTDSPTTAIISVPVIGSMKRTLDVNATIIFLERRYGSMYYNFQQLVRIYAEQLASADCSVDVNLINSRLGYIAEAESKAQAESIKEVYDRVSLGEPLVVYRNGTITQSNGLNVLLGNVKNQFVADMILDVKRTIICEFLTRIGINNANTDKKERVIVDEVNSNNIELMANTALWKYNLERCVKKTRKIFPNLDFDIKLRFDPSKMLNGGVINDILGRGVNMGNTQSKQEVL